MGLKARSQTETTEKRSFVQFYFCILRNQPAHTRSQSNYSKEGHFKAVDYIIILKQCF